MKILLPVADPPVKLYLGHAYTLSILMTNEKTLSWIYSNYIQLNFSTNFIERKRFIVNFYIGNMSKYYYNIPFIEVRSLERKFILNEINDMTKFVIHSLDCGYYVMAMLDEYYLSSKFCYNKQHYLHLAMINGYDCNEKCFYTTGFDIDRIYKEQKMTFSEFEKSISSMEGNNASVRDDFVMLIRMQNKDDLEFPQLSFNYFDYEFDKIQVKDSLKEYLESKCSANKFRMFNMPPENLKYGIEIYEYLKMYFEYIITSQVSEINFQAFHGIMEHKQMMVKRIEYMISSNFIAEKDVEIKAFKRVEELSIQLRNIILKFNMNYSSNAVRNLLDIAKEMKELEEEAISKLILVL